MLPNFMLGIMALDREQTSLEFENRLKEKRQASGFSQKQLAEMAGMTRQAVSAVEANDSLETWLTTGRPARSKRGIRAARRRRG